VSSHTALRSSCVAEACPKVSVICCFLDEERFLSEAIESVLAQDYRDYELILVDDGSKDASTTIAQDLADRHSEIIRYLEHPRHENRGLSASRNLGASVARGKFVAFIDADDVWTHGKLTEQLAIMEAIPELGMLCGTVRYWSSWNGGVDQIIRTGHVCNTVILAPEAALVLYPLGKAAAPCPSDLLLRREVGDLIGWFEESFTGLYEDQCFLIKVYLSAAVYFSDRVWLNYRLHDESLSSTVIRRGRYHEIRLDFLNWLETYLTGMPQPDLKVSAALHGVLSHYRTASDGNGPSVLPRSSNRALAAQLGVSIREVRKRRRQRVL
jgi:glycosyltransferase involved in cell wall biosynthesis